MYTKQQIKVGTCAFACLLACGLALDLFRADELPACGDVTDAQAACVVAMTMSMTDDFQADGSTKQVPIREQKLSWTVTREGRYQLEAKQLPRENKVLNPTIQVEDKWGLPMNVGMDRGLGPAANDYKTNTKNLKPGTYRVYVWSMADGPEQLQLAIKPLPLSEARTEAR